jgi:hypothetical protein
MKIYEKRKNNPTTRIEKNQSDFKFGDISPVEYSWRKSTAYSFSVISAFFLLKPFEFITTRLDRSN